MQTEQNMKFISLQRSCSKQRQTDLFDYMVNLRHIKYDLISVSTQCSGEHALHFWLRFFFLHQNAIL